MDDANFGFPTASGTIPQPSITLEQKLPPMIQDEECHASLLAYLIARLNSGRQHRENRLRRYMAIDKMVSTWQRLSEEDSQRKNKQEATGQAQAISINMPMVETHVEDMVAFFAGVYSPEAGDFFQLPDTDVQEQSKELLKKLNGDAKAYQYYKALCFGLRGLIKYNIGGYRVNWVDPVTSDEAFNEAAGQNRVEAIDLYNLLWDPTIKDPSKIRQEGEWAATVYNKNAMWLAKRDKAGVYAGTFQGLTNDGKEINIQSNQPGRVAMFYKNPPNHAGIAGGDDLTGTGPNASVNWASYGRSLENDGNLRIDGHEVIEMFCWLNPHDFELHAPGEPNENPNDYVLWRFEILNGGRIIKADPVPADEEAAGTPHPDRKPQIPYFLGYLKNDEMGSAQRSIAELLQPFQSFGSFLLNVHVAGSRNNIWGLQVYDPSMVDMGSVNTGTTAARLPSKTPGRDVRTAIMKVDGTVETASTMDDLAKLMQIMREMFPAQAMPSQVASMDRAVQSQVQAVLQGINRRLHMLVRVCDDDIFNPMRMSLFVNIARFKSLAIDLDDSVVQRILGSGLAQLNREAAAQAIQQLLFALIQTPQTAVAFDIPKLMNYWSGLINVNVDLADFVKQAPAAPAQVGPDGQPVPDSGTAGQGAQNGAQPGPQGTSPNTPTAAQA